MKLRQAHLVSYLHPRLKGIPPMECYSMAMNRIQFQRGMSLPEFLNCFGTEEQCTEALRRARWPDGFRCPRCDGSACCLTGPRGRLLNN